MEKPESRYERQDAIERILARSPQGMTSGELARELGVDASTIRRDMAALEKRGTGTTRDGRRYRLDHRRSLYTVRLNNHELLALYFAARLLSRHSDEHNPHVVVALERLADALRDRAPAVAQHIDLAARSVAARPHRYAYIEALQAITQGWIERRKVRLRYRDSKGEVTERICAPYVMEPYGIGYACHCIGHDSLRNKVRTFKIERITEATLLAEQFEIPSAYTDPARLLANAWGVIWSDEEAIEVVLRFSPAVARRIKESTWHHSQEVKDLPDGACLFTVHIGSMKEIKPWVRGWGADVEVISPPDFREDVAAELRRAATLYEN